MSYSEAFARLLEEHLHGVGMIWAQTESGVVGKDGGMPWHVPEDMRHFSSLTTGHPVVMGRRTWESFPAKYRPLPGRQNLVVTRTPGWEAGGAIVCSSLQEALRQAQTLDAGLVWVVGGGAVYGQAVAEGLADFALITTLESDTDGDTHAPELGPEFTLVGTSPETGWQTSRTGTRFRWDLHVRHPRPTFEEATDA
ncbi:dihydrofolate reductase [Psychromicrobium xiongbiense]|uniref:dihydrofolate reductase n=1 Tax=Psychromicrobium xiongbiense TaxID=3051184 RepID=UPI00255305A8|nr:dihydrofolate reductase [Psychromicrobium sp. YIM S02556]